MTQNRIPHMMQPSNSFVIEYPTAIEFVEKQSSVFWTDNQFNVEKDIQDIRTNMTDAERHGTLFGLNLFTHYERRVGVEYWNGKFAKWFPRHEFQRMAACFGNVEMNSHFPFYDKLSRVMGLDTDEFYLSYTKDATMSARMDYIDELVNSEDKLLSLGAFSMVEGAVLYSNFAWFKHFQSQGKNKLATVVGGINESVRDEDIHAQAGAWAFRTLKAQMKEAGIDFNEEAVNGALYNAAMAIYAQECALIDKTFAFGPVPGSTAHQSKNFVLGRLSLCLNNLQVKNNLKPSYDPISEWFYQGITGYQLHDFFRTKGREYHKSWQRGGFAWQP